MTGWERTTSPELGHRKAPMGADTRMNPLDAYTRYAQVIRHQVDQSVATWLGGQLASERALGPDVARVVDALLSLGTRGGKRIRAVLLSLAYEGTGGEGGASRVVNAAVAIELLQVYMLVHDDWMDGDLVRRGGPSVHKMLGDAFDSVPLGNATAVLAGDFASALAQEAMLAVDVNPALLLNATRRFARIQHDVVLGQVMDVCSEVRPLADLLVSYVEQMHAKKTGAYTVGGPLAIGALLAGATPSQVAAFDAFAAPLGVAFQLRDDLLGTFGAPESTGKPRFGDLRQGKRTSLVAAFLANASEVERTLLTAVLGHPNADEAACEKLAAAIESSGARARVEARVTELLDLARSKLGTIELLPEHELVLEGAIRALGERAS